MPDEPSSDATDETSEDSADGGSSAGGRQDKNVLEWAVTAAGALIVLFVVGFFVYELVAGASGPADLTVTLGEATVDSVTAEVPVEVRNEGQEVAERAVVEVCAGPQACAEISFDYVPYQSMVSGVVGLEAPLAAPLTARVVSYVDP